MIEKLIEQIERRQNLPCADFIKNPSIYIENIKDEVDEAKEQMIPDNKRKLEDEIWDVLWTTLFTIKLLEKEWKINSLENVINLTEEKFKERIDALDNAKDLSEFPSAWKEVKKKQKARLNSN